MNQNTILKMKKLNDIAGYEIGKIIYQQIKSDPMKTYLFWGIQSIILLEKGIMLNLTRKRKVIVKLNGWDLYDLEIGKMAGKFNLDYKKIYEIDSIYADQLVSLINSKL